MMGTTPENTTMTGKNHGNAFHHDDEYAPIAREGEQR
jgi:hypothetical protein